MKPSFFLLIFLYLSSPLMADPAGDFYRRGMQAVQQGDIATAEKSFLNAIKLRPNFPQARYQLSQLQKNRRKIHTQNRGKQLNSLILANISFDDLPLSDALRVLGQMITTESEKKDGKENAFHPNFNIQDPSGKLASTRVSLQLNQIPAGKALDYLLQQAGARARFDKQAIIILRP